MSDFKNVLKGGWHPKGKDGGKESWRGDFKGINQVAGWVGKGKTPGESAQSEHVSRPLATLKDPSSFGPPPKNVNYHGGAALPNEITPHRSGLGAPLTQEEITSARIATATPPAQELEDTSQKPPGPPLPYRSDRTGLRTDNLPPPPTHRDLRETSPGPTQQSARPTPNLPPRLPTRQNSTEPPPPSYELATVASPKTATPSSSSTLNQSAIKRLGNAGVSVPGLGIGRSSNNDATATSKPSPNLSDLQSRFSKMNTSFSNHNGTSSPTASSPQATSPQPQAQPQPPSWQQTRSALTTANSAYKDPSSVSMNDAQNAAATAQSAQQSAAAFRQRHNETINAAQTRASQLNKKYNMTGRLNKFLEDANSAHDQQQQESGTQAVQQAQPGQPQQQPQQHHQQYYQQHAAQSPPATQKLQASPWQTQHPPVVSSPPPQTSTPELVASISRKPPPPPPPKKPANMQAPPPVPLGTKPR